MNSSSSWNLTAITEDRGWGTFAGCLVEGDVQLHGDVLSGHILHHQRSVVVQAGEVLDGQQHQDASNL